MWGWGTGWSRGPGLNPVHGAASPGPAAPAAWATGSVHRVRLWAWAGVMLANPLGSREGGRWPLSQPGEPCRAFLPVGTGTQAPAAARVRRPVPSVLSLQDVCGCFPSRLLVLPGLLFPAGVLSGGGGLHCVSLGQGGGLPWTSGRPEDRHLLHCRASLSAPCDGSPLSLRSLLGNIFRGDCCSPD